MIKKNSENSKEKQMTERLSKIKRIVVMSSMHGICTFIKTKHEYLHFYIKLQSHFFGRHKQDERIKRRRTDSPNETLLFDRFKTNMSNLQTTKL